MKKELTLFEVEAMVRDLNMALGMMRSLEKDHPKAKITLNPETMRVSITYPLPKDALKVRDFIFRDLPKDFPN